MEIKAVENLELIYRLMRVHGESEETDYMVKFKETIDGLNEENKAAEALKQKKEDWVTLTNRKLNRLGLPNIDKAKNNGVK